MKSFTSNENELNKLSKKLKAVSTKGITKDLINKFSIINGQNIFLLECFKII